MNKTLLLRCVAFLLPESVCAQAPGTPAFPPSMVTGTLPVMTINTENNEPIVDKEVKLDALLDVELPDGYETYSRAEAVDIKDAELTIKGRGNASWLLDQKPYNLNSRTKRHFSACPSISISR